MWKFFKNHSELALAGLMIIFLAVIAAYFIWGVNALFADLNRALNAGNIKSAPIVFDLKGAAELDLKGLIK